MKTLLNKLKIPLLIVGMFISKNIFAQNTLKKDTMIFNYKISESYLKNEDETDSSDYIKLNVPVEKYGKSLIEKLTSKSFPNKILIKIIPSYDASYYNSNTQTVGLGDEGTYANRLSNFMHELGHAFDPKIKDRREINKIVRQEAMAFILEFTAPYLVEDKKLKNELSVYLELMRASLEEYGKVDEPRYGLHLKAMHLADATLTYFNNSIEAYNYLANRNYEEIDPKIFDIISNNVNSSSKK